MIQGRRKVVAGKEKGSMGMGREALEEGLHSMLLGSSFWKSTRFNQSRQKLITSGDTYVGEFKTIAMVWHSLKIKF